MSARFIPAGAGNTTDCRSSRVWRPVHPRRRGEHVAQEPYEFSGIGSSPQARGTRGLTLYSAELSRFIPAGAGNTALALELDLERAVHPRRRGEHFVGDCQCLEADGSSPQARGTPFCGLSVTYRIRFIPAGAGNTCVVLAVVNVLTVHPRRRGEHGLDEPAAVACLGSSPQARGTQVQVRLAVNAVRFIPAGAGNTSLSTHALRQATVHPRRRGEHPYSMYSLEYGRGSSPQARGTQGGGPGRARAASLASSVHPRRRGEHTTPLRRFIPAGAGNI